KSPAETAIGQSLPSIGWGWAKPRPLPRDIGAGDYLDSLATGADEWFKRSPGDAAALAQRLCEFRAGCAVIMFGQHRPLSEIDREWLVNRCRGWAKRIDTLLESLDEGSDVPSVRREADSMATNLVKTLRARAGRLRSRVSTRDPLDARVRL